MLARRHRRRESDPTACSENVSWSTKKPAIAFDACANVIDENDVPGYAASKSCLYSGMAPSLAISALQMPVKSLSGISASSLRVNPPVVIATLFCPRISVRDVTGKEADRRRRAELEHLRHRRRDLIVRRRVERAGRVDGDAAVPEELIESGKVEQRRRVPRNEDASPQRAVRAEADAAFADREILSVARGECGQMARHARHVAIAAQDRIERERLSELDQLRANVCRQRKRDDAVRRRERAQRIGGAVRRCDAKGPLEGPRVAGTIRR